jgi:endogenous inhibitor of DNA gyrase (YacG/DUF329 family)
MRDRHHVLPDANFDGPALLDEQTQMLSESTPSEINFLQFLKARLSAQQRATAQRNYWQRVQQEVDGGVQGWRAHNTSRSVTASSTTSNAIPMVDTKAYPAASSWNVQTTPVRTVSAAGHDNTALYGKHGEDHYATAHGARSPLDESSVHSGSIGSRPDASLSSTQQQRSPPQQQRSHPLAYCHASNEHLPASAAQRAMASELSALASPPTSQSLEGHTSALDEKPAIASGKPQVPAGAEDVKDIQLEPCPHCGRTFAPDRLQRHATTCERQQLANPKTKADGKERKVSSSSASSHVKSERAGAPAGAKVGGATAACSNGTTASSETAAASSGPAKMEKWRRQSAQLRSALAGTSTVEDDRVPCPHCGRRFAKDVAARHIPFCRAKEERRL